jgi:hypothetical protein
MTFEGRLRVYRTFILEHVEAGPFTISKGNI